MTERPWQKIEGSDDYRCNACGSGPFRPAYGGSCSCPVDGVSDLSRPSGSEHPVSLSSEAPSTDTPLTSLRLEAMSLETYRERRNALDRLRTVENRIKSMLNDDSGKQWYVEIQLVRLWRETLQNMLRGLDDERKHVDSLLAIVAKNEQIASLKDLVETDADTVHKLLFGADEPRRRAKKVAARDGN